MQRETKKSLLKSVVVIESDVQRQDEIRLALSHQTFWNFQFFDDLDVFMNSKPQTHLAIFLDLEHFDKTHEEEFGLSAISKLKQKYPKSEVIVFSDHENEAWAAKALKNGALDYIILNTHQFIKMEYELRWLEEILETRAENEKFKRLLIWIVIGFCIFIAIVVWLYEIGILKERNDPNVIIEGLVTFFWLRSGQTNRN